MLVTINETGGIIVKADNNTEISKIEDFLIKKRSWILKHVSERCEYFANHFSNFGLNDGNNVLIMGEVCTVENCQIKTKLGVVRLDEKNREWSFVEKMRAYAHKYLSARTRSIADAFGINYGKITISNAKKKWGSCLGKDLTFVFRLCYFPKSIIDYVIVHELCHIAHPNHQPQFWSALEKMMPNYKKAKDYLDKMVFLSTFLG